MRGNSKIVTELLKEFASSGWNVVNLIWGRKWNNLINNDDGGNLQKIMDETVDGEYQNLKLCGNIQGIILGKTLLPNKWLRE